MHSVALIDEYGGIRGREGTDEEQPEQRRSRGSLMPESEQEGPADERQKRDQRKQRLFEPTEEAPCDAEQSRSENLPHQGRRLDLRARPMRRRARHQRDVNDRGARERP